MEGTFANGRSRSENASPITYVRRINEIQQQKIRTRPTTSLFRCTFQRYREASDPIGNSKKGNTQGGSALNHRHT